MEQFFTYLGRFGHIIIQIALIGAQGYAAYLNGGKLGVANFGIAAIQALAADQALMATPPGPNPPQAPPKG